MRLLDSWLSELSPSQRILDLGCGAGSLKTQLAGMNVFGADVDSAELAQNRELPSACAESHRLPFADQSFDLVVCHHSMEHFGDPASVILEIRRVLKPGGRLFVSVPDGSSFSDRLYRLMLCGGGHLQRFSFESVVNAFESGAGLHLAGWTELFSSFIYVDKRNFAPSPHGPLPRRMRWLGHLPSWCFSGSRLFLNLSTRLADYCLPTRLSLYGWAIAFGPEEKPPAAEPGYVNVCMSCGSGLSRAHSERIAGPIYRCPNCKGLNVLLASDPS